mgnify:CR=1 FL=1|tara:strand:- start:46 stop:471 length:426 start_codon:yes stop_codon:yes gene_type:complete
MGYTITIKSKDDAERQKMYAFLLREFREWKDIFPVYEGHMTGCSVVEEEDGSVGFHYKSWIDAAERRYIYMIMVLLHDLGFGDGIWLYDGASDGDEQPDSYREYSDTWRHFASFSCHDIDQVISTIEGEVERLKQSWESQS